MRYCGTLILTVACFLKISAAAQESANLPSPRAALSRPCSDGSTAPAHKERPKTKSPASAREPASACLEAKGSPVDLQEFFQSYVREQRWRIGNEKIAEDSWIFSRLLERDELLQFAKEGALAGRVKWTEGKALLQITAHELDGGFTRVEVSAQFQAAGQNVDRFAPPRDSWDLESNGALEKLLIAALEAHLQSMH